MLNSGEFRNVTVKKLLETLRSQGRDGITGENLYAQVLSWLREAEVRSQRQLLRDGAEDLTREFETDGAELYLARLVELGVYPETLYVVYILFTFMPLIDRYLKTVLGDIKQRRSKAGVLREAAAIMDEFAKSTGNFEDSLLFEFPSSHGLSSPTRTADALYLYANAFFLREQLRDALDANSGEEIAKYTVASAIYQITGKYHDREVAATLGVFLEKPDYDETAYRVWRIRTFPRLSATCSFLPVILHALNSALVSWDRDLVTDTSGG